MVALSPLLIGMTDRVALIAVIALADGMFQAGINLVSFDELTKTVPSDRASIFTAVAQNLRYLSVLVGPLIGTALADRIGLPGGLFAGAAVRFLGFILFAAGSRGASSQPALGEEAQGPARSADPKRRTRCGDRPTRRGERSRLGESDAAVSRLTYRGSSRLLAQRPPAL